MSLDFNYMVGGEAGQGVQSVAFLLGKAMANGGYHVFSDQDYESRVRGGHNFFRVRVADNPVGAIREDVDVLVALNADSVRLHLSEVVSRGAVICDADKMQDVPQDSRLVAVPLEKLAVEKGGSAIMTNTVALGAALALINYDSGVLAEALKKHFGKAEVADKNIAAANAGFEHVRTLRSMSLAEVKPKLAGKRMIMNGNDALALGAISAGCKFMAAYPMTPTTSVMEYFAAHSKEYGLVMVHAEDEIAAVHMAIGASYAGVRAMTATSGSGFCLMSEGLGLAGMTETPLVIVEGQRAGPAIGFPTRTEQGDLLFLLHAHQGEFPRAILAPTSIEDCFWATVRAFNIADRCQMPVFVITDVYLANSFGTVEPFDLSRVAVDRGSIYSESDGAPAAYLRHKVTESGVSPRAFPGRSKALVVTDSDEHDEEGHLTEDAGVRTAQMDKRLRKLSAMDRGNAEPYTHGPAGADVLLIGWGSTYGALKEAADLLKAEVDVRVLQLSQLWPFPSQDVEAEVARSRSVFVVENNATGQLARLMRMEMGVKPTGNILKYDGRPFTPSIIADAVRKEVR